MNDLTIAPQKLTNGDERRAAALSEIQTMRDEFNAMRDELGQVKADLHQTRDRLALAMEDRNRYRAEALLAYSRIESLATTISNIGLMTVSAAETIRTMHETTLNAETPTDAELAKLEKEAVR